MTSPTTLAPPPSERSMSGREITAWICLATTLLVYTPYFIHVAGLFRRPGPLSLGSLVAPLLCAVAVQTLIGVIATLVFLLPHGREPKDERDLALEARAFRWGYYVLAAACFSVISALPGVLLNPLATNAAHPVLPFLLAEALLLGFVLAEATRYLLLVIGYRRGA